MRLISLTALAIAGFSLGAASSVRPAARAHSFQNQVRLVRRQAQCPLNQYLCADNTSCCQTGTTCQPNNLFTAGGACCRNDFLQCGGLSCCFAADVCCSAGSSTGCCPTGATCCPGSTTGCCLYGCSSSTTNGCAPAPPGVSSTTIVITPTSTSSLYVPPVTPSTVTTIPPTTVAFSTTTSHSSSSVTSSLRFSSVSSTTSNSRGDQNQSSAAPSTTSSGGKSSNAAAIGGGVGGGIAALIIAGLLAWFCMRKRKRDSFEDNHRHSIDEAFKGPGAAAAAAHNYSPVLTNDHSAMQTQQYNNHSVVSQNPLPAVPQSDSGHSFGDQYSQQGNGYAPQSGNAYGSHVGNAYAPQQGSHFSSGAPAAMFGAVGGFRAANNYPHHSPEPQMGHSDAGLAYNRDESKTNSLYGGMHQPNNAGPSAGPSSPVAPLSPASRDETQTFSPQSRDMSHDSFVGQETDSAHGAAPPSYDQAIPSSSNSTSSPTDVRPARQLPYPGAGGDSKGTFVSNT